MAIALEGNNPGGMNDGDWAKRQPGYAGPNGRYASFKTLSDGVNAMASLLLNSYIKKGCNTPHKIAHRWAPIADGNNSVRYASQLATRMGIGIDTPIAPSDARKLAIVQAGIENGKFATKWAAEQVRLAMKKPA
jgi:hypothetical protein